MKRRWHNADDLMRRAVEAQRLSQDIRPSAKASLPEPITDDHNVARVSVFRQERSTECWCDTEHLKEICRNGHRDKPDQRIQVESLFRLTKIRANPFARDELLSQYVQLQFRKARGADVVPRRDNSQQIIWVAKRERPENDGVNHREHGGADADGYRDSQDDDRGQAPIACRK